MSEEVKTETAAENQPAENRGNASRSSEGKPAERRGGQRRGGRFPRRRKFCKFCADKSLKIDHKDPELLGQFVTERFKIIPARVTGTCSFHQRQLTTAIKRARILALMAFTPLHKD